MRDLKTLNKKILGAHLTPSSCLVGIGGLESPTSSVQTTKYRYYSLLYTRYNVLHLAKLEHGFPEWQF